jgi:manganese/zinc/iron transport system permease protein
MGDPMILWVLLTGALVALSGALLGTFLMLRGQVMAGDAMAHAVLLGIVLVWMATGARSGPVVVLGAGAAGLACVLGADWLAARARIGRDLALGLVFPAMFALGVLLVSLNARNIHLDLDAVLLGEIGLVWLHEWRGVPVAVWTLGTVTLLNIAVLGLAWKEMVLTAFDPAQAALAGLRPRLMGGVVLALTSATAVAAFDAVGVVLFLAFLAVPAATGKLLARSVAGMLAVAVGSGLAAVALGMGAALALDVTIGGAMALSTAAGLLGALILRRRV